MTDITIIGGENPVFIKEELNKLINLFTSDERTIYYGDELNIEDFFVDLKMGSLFCVKRLIVVKQADQTKNDFEKLFLEYLKAPDNLAYLILEYAKIPPKILNAVTKLGNKIVTIYNFKRAWNQDQKRYVQRRFDDKKIKYSMPLIDLIVDLSGDNIEELSGMLDNLIMYLGDTKNLTHDDIQHVLNRAKNGSIFDLMDNIFQKNAVKALQAFYDLRDIGESFPAISAMFYRSVKIMWAVKTSQNGQIPQGFFVSPYEWRKYQGFAREVSLRYLSICLENISIIEYESKTRPELFAQMKFEQFLCNIQNIK